MELNEARQILEENGYTVNEGYSKDKYIICGVFDCEGTMKKLYFYGSSSDWTDDLFDASEYARYPEHTINYAKDILSPGTLDTLGCKKATLDHIEVLQVKTMGQGYRKNIKIIGKTICD